MSVSALLVSVSIVAVDQLHKYASLSANRRFAGIRAQPLLNGHAFVCRLSVRLAAVCLAVLVGLIIVVCVGSHLGGGRLGPLTLGLCCALSGASSNLYDRVHHGSVVDSLVVGGWLAFNIADTAVVCGSAAALLAILAPG